MSGFHCIVTTPTAGEFTRDSTKAYTHAVVRTSPRALRTFERYGGSTKGTSGVDSRWVKDRGFVVTYHGSEAAAKNAASEPYDYDSKTTVVGVFPVTVAVKNAAR